MQRLALAGHYGHNVDLDLCRSCDLVWFDGSETAQLSGPALLELIAPHGRVARTAARDAARRPALPALRRPVEDRPQPVALGPVVAAPVRAPPRRVPVVRAVPRGEGAAQADVADRSRQAAARPRPDRLHQLRRRDRPRPTSAADGAARSRACSTSPASRARSTRSTRSSLTPSTGPRRARARCSARRAARRCPKARRSVARSAARRSRSRAWPRPTPRCDALAPALRAAAARPSPDVVKRRLDALDEDLPRRREWAAAMQAEADARRGRSVDETDWEEVSPTLETRARHPRDRVRALDRMERRPALKSSSRGWRRRARRSAGPGARPLARTGGAR